MPELLYKSYKWVVIKSDCPEEVARVEGLTGRKQPVEQTDQKIFSTDHFVGLF